VWSNSIKRLNKGDDFRLQKMSSQIDSINGSLFRNDVLPSQDESVNYSDLHLSNVSNFSLPSLTMASSQESSDLNDTTMNSSREIQATGDQIMPEGDVEAGSVSPPLRDAPSKQRATRMIVDVDAYMDDEEDDEDPVVDENEDLYGTTVVTSNRVKSDEDLYGKTVVISNVSNSSLIPEDDEVPSPTASPERSPSQKAAVNAVLGYDADADYDDDLYFMKSQLVNGHDLAAELTDDELAAAVPPHLRRHASSRNSTPGAFLVRGSGMVSLAPTAAMTCDTDAENGMGHPPTLIAATLVDPMASYSSVEGVDNYHKASPTLVFAEPLWWKRRLVLCISGWMLLALGVITLSATLAYQFTENRRTDLKATNNASATPTMLNIEVKSTSAPTVSPIMLFAPALSPVTLLAPTVSPVTLPSQTYAPSSTVAYHAASWGLVSTCEEENSPFYSNDLFISCGGGILEIINTSDGVECQSVAGTVEEMTCQLNQTTVGWNAVLNANATQASGLVLFSCRGSVMQDQTATADLPEAPVASNCLSLSDPLASNFVSLGRFCFEQGSNWILRQETYLCEGSHRGVIPTGKRSHLRRSLSLLDWFRDVVKLFGLTSFCYNELNCTSSDCIAPQTVMSDFDTTCVISGDGVFSPNMDEFWKGAQTGLEPSKRIDSLISGPVAG
jgi:ABC-type amino acid transport substrate-binding protein